MTRLIGVDWSAERFRAWRLDARGTVLDRRESRDGLRRAARRGAEKILSRHVGGWLEAGTTIVLSSAVFDRRDWIETPLLNVPLDVAALVDGAVRQRLGEATIVALPGAALRAPGASDVMRRETLLALGTARGARGRDGARDGHRLVVVPGPRSRWIRVVDGRITAFRTAIGGELLGLLLDGAFGRVVPGGGAGEDAAFLDGVEQGYRTRHVVTDLFAVRAAALLDENDPGMARPRLIGLLIGNEIREAEAALEATGEALTLVGEDAAVDAHARALRHLGTTVAREGTEAAARAGFAAVFAALPPAPPGVDGEPARAGTLSVGIAANTPRLDVAPGPTRTPRDWDDAFGELPLLAFLPALDPRGTLGVATTLVEAGFRILVVPMRDARTSVAADGGNADILTTIRRLSAAFGTRVCIGVRDVPTPKDASAAIDAGARVVVASGSDDALARRCAKRNVAWVPGVATVTEGTRALALGARALLLYPADMIEPRIVQALRRALPADAPLVPAGGLHARTLLPYAAAGADGVAADETLVDPRAKRTDGVTAARTFVRTWRRIARGRRALDARTRVTPRPDVTATDAVPHDTGDTGDASSGTTPVASPARTED